MTLLNLLLPILALASSADLRLPAPGRFIYRGEFEVLQKRVTEGVPTNTSDGLARIAALRKEGYACTSLSNDLARCVGFVSTEGAAAEVKDRVDTLMKNSALEFGPLQGEPSLQSQGEIYEEWSIPQAGSFRGTAFNGYRYQILTDGPHKMLFGSDGVVVGENGFLYVASIQRQLKKYVIASYIIGAKLR